MTDHPVTPTPELVQRLCAQTDATWLDRLELAYQAGADAELEACVLWMECHPLPSVSQAADDIRTARRPKPKSLAEEALKRAAMLEELAISCGHDSDGILRLALERLQELEGGNG